MYLKRSDGGVAKVLDEAGNPMTEMIQQPWQNSDEIG